MQQRFDILVFRADAQTFARFRDIGLVPDDKAEPAACLLEQLFVLIGQRRAGVQNDENQIGFVKLLLRFLDADFFDFVIGLPQPGRVDQIELDAPDMDAPLDDVPRRARNAGDNGFVFFQQRVQQRAFADVGPADKDGVDAALDDLPVLRPFQDAVDF